ncbi:MAG: radical SAM protein [Lachnospiraceae bacterium]|nr:radical SAM protein [Lachnospiraceae bacterium]
MADCTLCPRKCHANRLQGVTGYCSQTAELSAARAALHFWEEPCISGSSGSGAVFFSGCNMKCIFCQNHGIATENIGRHISIDRLSEIFLELQAKHANNINLVTATHFIPQVCIALRKAKVNGLTIPVVYNTGGYEEVSSLRLLDGLVDIYLPDLKYYSSELSTLCSNAPDYFDKASAAISEMYRQVGPPVFEAAASDTAPLLKKGMLVRHLVLPGQSRDSKKVIRYLYETYGNDIYVSIMKQYTPLSYIADVPFLNRRVTEEEYNRILTFSSRLGIENGFCQEGDPADESFIPEFDFEGL